MRKAVADAVSHYNDLLASRYFTQTVESLDSAIAAKQLTVAGRPVCNVLRPQFLHSEDYAMVISASQLVLKGFREIAERLITDSALRSILQLGPEEEQLILVDTGYGAADVSARLDGFLDEQGHFQFVEYNADSPGGIAFGDVLADAFSSLPLLQEFAKRFPYRTVPARSLTFDALMGAYQRWGGQGLPNIAIVDWRETMTRSEFELMREHFEERGCAVRISAPDELDYRDGHLYAADFKVDFVYKRIVVFELLERLGIEHPLVRAVRDRAVCMANGFAVQLLFQKSLFALLSDPAFYKPQDTEVAAALQRHLPWTRLVRECMTNYKERRVDLLSFIAENKERLVLKPCSEYGGKGVWLGWECSEEQWQEAIRTSLGSAHIVQERVVLGSEEYPASVDGKLQYDRRYFDLDPYVWQGERIEGCGVRLSRGALLNVSAGGGSATPLFILR